MMISFDLYDNPISLLPFQISLLLLTYYYCQVSLLWYQCMHALIPLTFQQIKNNWKPSTDVCMCLCVCFVFVHKEARLWVGGYDRQIILSHTLLYFGLWSYYIYDISMIVLCVTTRHLGSQCNTSLCFYSATKSMEKEKEIKLKIGWGLNPQLHGPQTAKR